MRALISVFDKTGVDVLAQGLADLGWEIVSSGGTADHLSERGLDVVRIEDVTGAPEMLGGRVKTLHPRVHAGILARRDNPDDAATLDEHEIEPFDLVCVNLYPFSDVVARHGVREEDAVEMIDIGGPSMLRAAAKNFAHVAPLCRAEQYEPVLAELRSHGELSPATRKRLATEAFAESAAYEATIARWFADVDTFPPTLIPAFTKVLDLTYGENPHQRAAYYAESGARMHLLSRVEQVSGKPLSYNNLNDLSAARLLAREFALPTCVIVKHANPCGVAVGASIDDAYAHAAAADPKSAYGGVIVLNRPVTGALGARLAEEFVEVLLATGFDDDARRALAAKGTRVLLETERRRPEPGERDYKRVIGGLLVQDRDLDIQEREGMNVVAGEVREEQWGELLFAWRVCKHVASNAVVLSSGLRTIGIGAGQQSRVDAVKIALAKAEEHGHDTTGAVLASDAFFPFADGPRLGLDAGVAAIIQPGGSKRDAEVVEAVNAAGAAMVFTGRRHFRH